MEHIFLLSLRSIEENFLTTDLARTILRQVWKEVSTKHPFNVEAICLLPNHIHCIWKMPEGDYDYPKRLRLIKAMFSRRYITAGGKQDKIKGTRQKKVRMQYGSDDIGNKP